MRNMFPEYAPPQESYFDLLWSEGLFVFDTNVLLSIHVHSDEQNDWIIKELERLHDRIWIPHQVALEFVRNRTSRITERIKRLNNVYNEFKSIENDIKLSLKRQFESVRMKYDFDDFPDFQEDLRLWLNPYLEKIVIEKTELEKRLNIDDDHIFLRIESLFKDRIGKPFSRTEEFRI